MQALEKVHAIISVAKGSMELLAELDTLYKCCKFAVVSVGVIRWVQTIVCQHNYFRYGVRSVVRVNGCLQPELRLLPDPPRPAG